jgi:hypothetical protein
MCDSATSAASSVFRTVQLYIYITEEYCYINTITARLGHVCVHSRRHNIYTWGSTATLLRSNAQVTTMLIYSQLDDFFVNNPWASTLARGAPILSWRGVVSPGDSPIADWTYSADLPSSPAADGFINSCSTTEFLAD